MDGLQGGGKQWVKTNRFTLTVTNVKTYGMSFKTQAAVQIRLDSPSSGNNEVRGLVWLLGHARSVTKVHGYFKRRKFRLI